MLSDLFLLTILAFAIPVVFLVYVGFREWMMKSTIIDMPTSFYTKFRVLRTTTMMVLLISLSIGYVLLIVLSILNRYVFYPFSYQELILFLIFFSIGFVIVYGTGIYISAILTEQYTMGNIKKIPSYKFLALEIQLLHGPESHVLVYSGTVALLMIVALFEASNMVLDVLPVTYLLYAVYGVAIGIIFYISQIYNQTWKHQMPMTIGIYCLYLFLLVMGVVDLKYMPFNIFFFVFITVYLFLLLARYVHHKETGSKYKYDFSEA